MKTGQERRQFLRLDYVAPLGIKICKRKTVSKLLEGYTANVSEAGLLCRISEKIKKNDLLWLSFNRSILDICADLEKRAMIYQNGIIGKVVRIAQKSAQCYDVGIQFVTREEKNFTHIYPKAHFLEKELK